MKKVSGPTGARGNELHGRKFQGQVFAQEKRKGIAVGVVAQAAKHPAMRDPRQAQTGEGFIQSQLMTRRRDALALRSFVP